MSIHIKKDEKIHVKNLQDKKIRKEKITMLTAYDYSMAKLLDQAGVDIILAGDSAANVMAGHQSTLPITLDQMIYHAACVKRGVSRALVVADLPFGSYHTPDKALKSAIRMMKEANIEAVKLEGGVEIQEAIKNILAAGIPVMGHLGLTPQHIHRFGNYGVRARGKEEARKLLEDAKKLALTGCFALVLEKIPTALAQKVSHDLRIPTLGIGAGACVDGQVLVINDLLGMNKDFQPKFVRTYIDLHSQITKAVKNFIKDVQREDFPNSNEQYQ